MIREGITACLAIGALSAACLCGGCGAAYRAAPTLGFGEIDVRANLTRSDIVVEDRVEGTSSDTEILAGLIDIVDKDKLGLFFGLVKFYKDKTVSFDQNGRPLFNAANRAYFNALEQAPDADAVLQKSVVEDVSGIPFLDSTVTCTFSGKAVKLRSDSNRVPDSTNKPSAQ